ncbi:hypothetical protein LCGC14_1307570 [marine sediment metagenome]|uniref:Uncharacterized protein n=1 Tax=marine sediment metagenome TaxID=412755 RepID=A0A0F9NQQ8_9ZZZZ
MLFGRDHKTIKELRYALGKARAELFEKENEIVNLKWWLAADPDFDSRYIAPERKIPRRAPSDVFFIPHPEDLLR